VEQLLLTHQTVLLYKNFTNKVGRNK